MQRTLITKRARAMRKAMTSAEALLWTRLRGRAEGRPTFRRRHPFGGIILDFYCAEARLAVEVDGATHWSDEAQAKDAARDHWLKASASCGSRPHGSMPTSMAWRTRYWCGPKT
jgi:very-short-patch-repair endonuclease